VILGLCPFGLPEVWIDVIGPTFTALSGSAPGHCRCDSAPIACVMLLYNLEKSGIFPWLEFGPENVAVINHQNEVIFASSRFSYRIPFQPSASNSESAALFVGMILFPVPPIELLTRIR
jgi:hypothetical protein